MLFPPNPQGEKRKKKGSYQDTLNESYNTSFPLLIFILSMTLKSWPQTKLTKKANQTYKQAYLSIHLPTNLIFPPQTHPFLSPPWPLIVPSSDRHPATLLFHGALIMPLQAHMADKSSRNIHHCNQARQRNKEIGSFTKSGHWGSYTHRFSHSL